MPLNRCGQTRRGPPLAPSPTCSLLAVTVISCAFVIPAWGWQGPIVSDEYRLKAAFVYRFPQFVEWPTAAIDGRDSLDICITRPNPFGNSLQELVAGESMNGRRLVVRSIELSSGLRGCHVLFVANRDRAPLKQLLARTARQPVLTIGESAEFLEDGGIVNLRVIDQRVRFEVNAAAAEQAGLKLSSQLLRLAIRVVGPTA